MQVKREMAARARRAGGIVAAGTLALVLALVGTEVAGESDGAEGGFGMTPAVQTGGLVQRKALGSGYSGPEIAAALVSTSKDRKVRSAASAVLTGDKGALLEQLGCKVLTPMQVVQAEAAGILPRGFRAEVLALEAYDDVMVDSAASLVGFTCEGDAGQVFAGLVSQLVVSGWRYEESGLGVGGSFAKESGVLRWLFIMCYQVENETVVVLQYR